MVVNIKVEFKLVPYCRIRHYCHPSQSQNAKAGYWLCQVGQPRRDCMSPMFCRWRMRPCLLLEAMLGQMARQSGWLLQMQYSQYCHQKVIPSLRALLPCQQQRMHQLPNLPALGQKCRGHSALLRPPSWLIPARKWSGRRCIGLKSFIMRTDSRIASWCSCHSSLEGEDDLFAARQTVSSVSHVPCLRFYE